MSTDINLLGKALIRLAILIILFIASPVLITISFKAIDTFTEVPNLYFAYFLVIVGFALLIYTIFFAFKTFRVLQNAFFKNQ